MATLEREFSARWGVDEVFRYFRDGILAGSQSVTDGGGSVYETEGARFIVRVFERFSLTDRDLVSLSLLLADLGDGRIRLTGITAGCGRLEKLWTYGEEAFLKKLTKLGFISGRKNRETAEKYRSDLSIKVPGIKQMVVNLSGGNQQKVVLAKALAADPEIIIFDEPTKGIDVGAKQEIYQLMNTLAEAGKAIIMISSDMEEILGMSDRIVVLHEGTVAGELHRDEFSQERVLQLASGM